MSRLSDDWSVTTTVGHVPHAQLHGPDGHLDVLVFPSLFEGFGLVILEALSQGLPVIATPSTGAPDVLTDGEDGWIVPTRSSAAIQDRLQRLLDEPGLLSQMSERARETARSRSWATYRADLVQVLTASLPV